MYMCIFVSIVIRLVFLVCSVEIYWEDTWFISELVQCFRVPHIQQALDSWLRSGGKPPSDLLPLL